MTNLMEGRLLYDNLIKSLLAKHWLWLLCICCLGCGESAPLKKLEAVAEAPVELESAEPILAEAPTDNTFDSVPKVEPPSSTAKKTEADSTTEVNEPTSIVGQFVVPLAEGYRPPRHRAAPLVANLLEQARTAMSHRDMVTTSNRLRLSPAKDPSSDDALELERTWLLSRLLVKFWSGVRAGTEDVQVNSKIEFNDELATVSAKRASNVRLKFSDGTEEEFSLAPPTVPATMAEALARKGLVESGPAADRMIVAFHLLDRQGDRDRAALLCTRLERAGMNIDEFLPEL